MGFTIYGLRVVESQEIFYVGCTRKNLKLRFTQHLQFCDVNRVKEIILSKNDCEIFEIEKSDDLSISRDRENFWIQRLRKKGYFLCNKEQRGSKGSAYLVSKRYTFKIDFQPQSSFTHSKKV